MAVIDEPGKGLYMDIGDVCYGRIDPQVKAVGWNDKHIIVKQNRFSVTNFYIIDHTKDHPFADAKDVVAGPLAEKDFWLERSRLGVASNLTFTVFY